MLFYAVAKEIKISNRYILVKRAGVGYYYRLLHNIISIQDHNAKLIKLQNEENPDLLKVNLNQFFIEKKRLENAIMVNVEPFINIKWKNIKDEDKKTVIDSIINFNSYELSNGEGQVKLKDIESQHNFIIAFLLERGYTIKEASEINNYQAMAMIAQWKEMRTIEMADLRVANNAEHKEYRDYILKLKGFNFMTPEEIIRKGY